MRLQLHDRHAAGFPSGCDVGRAHRGRARAQDFLADLRQVGVFGRTRAGSRQPPAMNAGNRAARNWIESGAGQLRAWPKRHNDLDLVFGVLARHPDARALQYVGCASTSCSMCSEEMFSAGDEYGGSPVTKAYEASRRRVSTSPVCRSRCAGNPRWPPACPSNRPWSRTAPVPARSPRRGCRPARPDRLRRPAGLVQVLPQPADRRAIGG